jgi:hypothetical protein
VAGSCGGPTSYWMIAASPARPISRGDMSWSTTRLPTQTRLSNRRCPIQEQRLTRSAPGSHRCRSLHTSLTRRSQSCRGLRMSPTKACSRWTKVRRERADSEHPDVGPPWVPQAWLHRAKKCFLWFLDFNARSIARCGTAQSCRTTFSSEL